MNNDKLTALHAKLIEMADAAHAKNDIDRLLRLCIGIKDLSEAFGAARVLPGGQEKFTPNNKPKGLSQ